MASFLRDEEVLKASIIAVQEPWKNTFSNTTHQPASASFQLLYPKTPEDEPPGVGMYISKKLDPREWSCQLVNRDYQILKLRKAHRGGDWTDLFVHNVYNRPGTGLPFILRHELRKRPYGEHVVIGDMNVHHPLWGGPGADIDREAEDLLTVMDEFKMDLLTEEGKPTWERAGSSSVIDLTFVSETLTERLVQSGRADDIEHQSDHYPIRTVIDIETPLFERPQRRNWAVTDSKALTAFIEEHLHTRDMSTAGKMRIELECQAFIRVIRAAIDASTPWAKPSEWSNPDFTMECRMAVKTVRFLRRKWVNTRDPYYEEQYKKARNQKNRLIKGTLTKAHRRRVQRVIENGPKGMWRLAKWARNRTGSYDRGVTPTLKQTNGTIAETVEEKSAAFQQAFFPQLPDADLSDIDGFQYPSEPIRFPEIMKHEIQDAIRLTPAEKAPGEDTIPNSFWHKVIEIPVVLNTLHQLYNACVREGYNPSHFQRSITVVLRKPGDRDYQLAKSYRPVALLNTIAKFLESIIARRISYVVEEEGLLPETHLGGRRGISKDHAIQIMIDRIRTAWGKGQTVSLLTLDVSGAYDYVSHIRLIHNLQKRRLGQLAPWTSAFLTGRSTRIRMPEGISDRIQTPTGIPQGSPLSPILYLLYNADLIQDCSSRYITTNGWVDDTSFMAIGRPEAQNIARLQERESTASTEGSRRRRRQRYLGFWLDAELTFEHHCEKALIKGCTSLHALRSLAGSTWGASLSAMRRIYQAVIVPQILFGVAAWYTPLMGKGAARIVSKRFASLQKRAVCLIGGAFKTSSAEALNVEMYLPPIGIQMDRIAQETALRLRTGPMHAIPKAMLQQRPESQRKRGGWTPMEVQAWKKGGCLTAPPEAVAGEWESRKAFVRAPWQVPPAVFIDDRGIATQKHAEIYTKPPEEVPLIIYTDGSGIEGKVGAAALVNSTGVSRRCHMGTDEVSTVYSAELRGAEMALEMAKELDSDRTQNGVVIFSDSQAALKALLRPRMPSGQIYLCDCNTLLQQLSNQGIDVVFRWIPAHEGIAGNELVDSYAKEAAKGETPSPHDRNIQLASAAKRRIRTTARISWERSWEKEKSGKATKRLLPVPTKKVLEFWKGQRKASASIMMQMRLNIVGVNRYLWRINKADSPDCSCHLGQQTPKHVLLECPLYEDERREMRYALSEKGVPPSLPFTELIQQKPAVPAITAFIMKTKLLGQFHFVDPQATGVEEDAEQQS
ncbi:reverse transcriptase [Penicillium lagena]|uniref:reverse transcriptase n=1 Tax=Penicillium lagena TaxID=94218 RepID=UPI002541B4E9|nr:reverse transcriptase [Penicillium lagena]KAJ5598905.1 reverse transcriptase [Penicillium lagena]